MNELWIKLAKLAYKKLLEMIITPEGGVGIAIELDGGNVVEEDRMRNVANLKALCEEAVSNLSWAAHDITGDGIPETFCNRAAQFIAQGMGFYGFRRDQSANQMIQAMTTDPAWREEIDLDRVAKLANRGVLVMICLSEDPHGHVVAAYPAEPETSSTWGGLVPMIAQVGTAKIGNGIKRLSAAYKFADRPSLRCFILEASEA